MLNLERDVEVLRSLARYYVLNRAQIQRLHFKTNQGDRIARRRLQELLSERLINRTQVQVLVPGSSPAPAYYPSPKGCDFLHSATGDDRYLLTPTQTPNSHHLYHWLAISDVHIALDEALKTSDAECPEWLNEWDVANKDAEAPEKRYRIYTLIQTAPKLVCAPDAAFLLSVRSMTKVHYLELDRGTSGVKQVASSKTPGYAAMAERALHLRHFSEPALTSFAVLMVAPTETRRELLRKAIGDKPGAPAWRFACKADLTPEKFLTAPVWHRCDGEVVPLVKGGAS